MQGEFNLSDLLVLRKIHQVVKIVNVVYLSLKCLLLFKLVGHVKALHPLRIKIVHNNFCLSNLRPHVSFFLIENKHTISSCKSIQVWQVFASESQS